MSRHPVLAWALLCGASALLTACSQDGAGCATPLGEPIRDTLYWDIQPDALEVRDRIEVHWWPGDSVQQTVVHAWQGTVDGIHVGMKSGVLVIEDRNRCAWARRLDAVPRVDLFGMRPSEVQLESQADLTMKAPWIGGDLMVDSDEMAGDVDLWFQGDSLRLRLPNGIGHATVRGQARRFSSFRSGFGDLEASGMEADQILVHHAGLGEVRLRPQGYLFLEMAGAGDALLQGDEAGWDIRILPGATGTVTVVP